MTTSYAVFGRKIIETAGWPPESVALVDLEHFGRACSDAMGKGREMPDPNAYIAAPGEAPAAVQSRQAPAPVNTEKVRRAYAESSQNLDIAPLVPRNMRELIRLVELGVLSKSRARPYLGLREHWWSR